MAVAPFTGAWIETPRRLTSRRRPARRSLHGSVDRNSPTSNRIARPCRRSLHGSVDRNRRSHGSRSARRCRSLHGSVDRNWTSVNGYRADVVAPFTGAWIETGHSRRRPTRRRSLPSRERGSKLGDCCQPQGVGRRSLHGSVDRNFCSMVACLPTPSRSLHGSVDRNRDLTGKAPDRKVAPFTGAWIETAKHQHAARFVDVAPFTGAWIETPT